MNNKELTWKNRKECLSTREATEMLADCVKNNYDNIIRGSIGMCNFLLGEMSEFAYIWDVPFDQNVYYEMAKNIEKNIQGDDYSDSEEYEYGWNASSC